jgi:hypothetical protein
MGLERLERRCLTISPTFTLSPEIVIISQFASAQPQIARVVRWPSPTLGRIGQRDGLTVRPGHSLEALTKIVLRMSQIFVLFSGK